MHSKVELHLRIFNRNTQTKKEKKKTIDCDRVFYSIINRPLKRKIKMAKK